MDPNAVAAARAGKPMLSHSQVPSRYPVNSYYAHPSSMAYQSQSQVPQTHRSLSQGPVPSPYSMPSTPAPSNGIAGKSNMVDPMDFKTEDTLEDPSKQQMFHPLLHSRSRPQTPSYYPNMQQPTNPPYYSTQRSMPGSPADYNMAAAAAAAQREGCDQRIPMGQWQFNNVFELRRVRLFHLPAVILAQVWHRIRWDYNRLHLHRL